MTGVQKHETDTWNHGSDRKHITAGSVCRAPRRWAFGTRFCLRSYAACHDTNDSRRSRTGSTIRSRPQPRANHSKAIAEATHEGSTQCQEDLRQVQDYQAERHCPRDLR